MKKWLLCAIIAIISAIPYIWMMDGRFCYDDIVAVAGNPDVLGLTDIKSLFFHDFWGNDMLVEGSGWTHHSWRPLVVLTFRWNHFQGNGDTLHYHVFNVICNAVTSVLFYLFIEKWFQNSAGNRKYVPFLSAVFYALNAVRSESISNITSRADLVASVFCFLASLSYLDFSSWNKNSRSERRSIFVLLKSLVDLLLFLFWLLCGIMSKELVIALPIALMILQIGLNLPEAMLVVAERGHKAGFTSLTMFQLIKLWLCFGASTFPLLKLLSTVILNAAIYYIRVIRMSGGYDLSSFAHKVHNPLHYVNSTSLRLLGKMYVQVKSFVMCIFPFDLVFDHSGFKVIEDYKDPRIYAALFVYFIMFSLTIYALFYIFVIEPRRLHRMMGLKSNQGEEKEEGEDLNLGKPTALPAADEIDSTDPESEISDSEKNNEKKCSHDVPCGKVKESKSVDYPVEKANGKDHVPLYATSSLHSSPESMSNATIEVSYISRQLIMFLVGLGYFIILYFPSSHVLLFVAFAIAERVLFLPSTGIAIIISSVVDYCLTTGVVSTAPRKTLSLSKFQLLVLVLTVALCIRNGLRAYDQNLTWSSPLSMHLNAMVTYPRGYFLEFGTGSSMMGTPISPTIRDQLDLGDADLIDAVNRAEGYSGINIYSGKRTILRPGDEQNLQRLASRYDLPRAVVEGNEQLLLERLCLRPEFFVRANAIGGYFIRHDPLMETTVNSMLKRLVDAETKAIEPLARLRARQKRVLALISQWNISPSPSNSSSSIHSSTVTSVSTTPSGAVPVQSGLSKSNFHDSVTFSIQSDSSDVLSMELNAENLSETVSIASAPHISDTILDNIIVGASDSLIGVESSREAISVETVVGSDLNDISVVIEPFSVAEDVVSSPINLGSLSALQIELDQLERAIHEQMILLFPLTYNHTSRTFVDELSSPPVSTSLLPPDYCATTASERISAVSESLFTRGLHAAISTFREVSLDTLRCATLHPPYFVNSFPQERRQLSKLFLLTASSSLFMSEIHVSLATLAISEQAWETALEELQTVHDIGSALRKLYSAQYVFILHQSGIYERGGLTALGADVMAVHAYQQHGLPAGDPRVLILQSNAAVAFVTSPRALLGSCSLALGLFRSISSQLASSIGSDGFRSAGKISPFGNIVELAYAGGMNAAIFFATIGLYNDAVLVLKNLNRGFDEAVAQLRSASLLGGSADLSRERVVPIVENSQSPSITPTVSIPQSDEADIITPGFIEDKKENSAITPSLQTEVDSKIESLQLRKRKIQSFLSVIEQKKSLIELWFLEDGFHGKEINEFDDLCAGNIPERLEILALDFIHVLDG